MSEEVAPTGFLSSGEHLAIGALSGIFELLCQQPLLYIKNCIQQNHPISFRPTVLYRGVGIMSASMAPVTGVQFAVDGTLSSYLYKTNNVTPSDATRIGTAASAGACSSFLSSPAELVMTLQQRTGHSLVQTTSDVVQKHGFTRLFVGIPLTMTREIVWCASFLALGPVFSEKLHDGLPGTFGDRNTASISQRTATSLIGSVGAGLVAVFATQPVDTIKTIVQGKGLEATPASAVAEFRTLFNGGGIKALYKGTIPRGVRLVGAVFILSETKKVLEDQAYKLKGLRK
ncbi:hypothetical protein AC1031_004190 [Aphanomyces cochlioides]|nr:hypothetical protein AC1031_004190 [Aphanomyces cochlioides]